MPPIGASVFRGVVFVATGEAFFTSRPTVVGRHFSVRGYSCDSNSNSNNNNKIEVGCRAEFHSEAYRIGAGWEISLIGCVSNGRVEIVGLGGV